jgi:hypothetical protein
MLLLSSGAFEQVMIEAADQKNSGVQPPSPLEAVAQHAQLTEWRAAEHQTTNLGVRSSNLFGRAIKSMGWMRR